MKKIVKRIKKKKVPAWRKKSLLLFLLMGAVLGVTGYVFYISDVLSVKEVRIQGSSAAIDSHVLSSIKPADESLIPEHNILFFPSQEMIQSLQTSFPEVSRIQVGRDFFKRIVTLRIQEKDEIALVCTPQGACFSVDADGVTVKTRTDKSLPLFFFTEEKEIKAAEQVIDPLLLSSLLSFKNDLEHWNVLRDQHVDVFSFSLASPQKIEALFSEGWAAYLNSQEDMDWQKVKLTQVLEKEIGNEKRHAVEYIDVRFGDQAYVKYK